MPKIKRQKSKVHWKIQKWIAGIPPSLFYFAKAAKKPVTADKSAKQKAGRHTGGGFATADKSSLSFDFVLRSSTTENGLGRKIVALLRPFVT